MANKQRGEVAFSVECDGSAERFTLRLSTNAMCELEAAFNASIQTVFARLDAGEAGVRLTALRTVMRDMLADRHPDKTDERTGEIMDALGFDEAARLIGEAAQLAFPEAKETPGELKGAAKAAA